MKTAKALRDIALVLACVAIVYLSEDWWVLMGLVPLFFIPEIQPKPAEEKTATYQQIGLVTYCVLQGGKTIEVQSLCAPQFNGEWVHFPDEITEFGYYPKQSFFRPEMVYLKEETAETH